MNKYFKLACKAYSLAESKKADDPVLLDVARLTAVADYLLIVTAGSAPHIKAVSDAVFKTFRDELGMLPGHRDGMGSPNWTVLDYGGLVVHVMNPECRRVYALDKMWFEARKVGAERISKALERKKTRKRGV
jgi:ribosome-associated protein